MNRRYPPGWTVCRYCVRKHPGTASLCDRCVDVRANIEAVHALEPWLPVDGADDRVALYTERAAAGLPLFGE